MKNQHEPDLQTPSISLSEGFSVALASPYFYHSTDGELATQRTFVSLRLEDGFLRIIFECLDNPFTSQNTFKEHNSSLWKQEVFEVFISAGFETPKRYLEVEINPNNALFLGWVTNESGLKPDHVSMVPYESAPVKHHVEIGESSWKGELAIPLSFLGSPAKQYRINFYRITLKASQETKDWENSNENSDFLCWNSTLSGSTPAFHRPKYFGILSLSNPVF